MKKVGLLHLIISIVFNISGFAQVQQTNDPRVMLQGFYWESYQASQKWYTIVKAKAPEIGTAGIDLIWLPPPSDAGSPQGYLPRELNKLSNYYGTETMHKEMLDALKENHVDAIADIVINHRVGSSNWIDFKNPTWASNSITQNDEVWNEGAYQNGFSRGNYDTGSNYEAARDIDHSQAWVRDEIKTWMNKLKTFGYSGWRYDFVHGFSASYFKEYNEATNPVFAVGENWAGKQDIQNWADASGTSAFDFATYYNLKNAIRNNSYGVLNENGKPSGGIGWTPQKYATFLENHDTPAHDSGNNFLNSGNVVQGYAYLLTHPGVPTIFWPHYFDWGVKAEIDKLIKVRKDNGITSTSTVEIKRSENGLYAAVIDGKLVVKLGGNNWQPSDSGIQGTWNVYTSGTNYMVWTQGEPGPDPEPEPEPDSTSVFTVHYFNSNNWPVPYIYYWGQNGSKTPASAIWPGQTMIADSIEGWYRFTIDGSTKANMVFSNNGAQTDKTADLFREFDGFYKDGVWTNVMPEEEEEIEPIPGAILSLYYYNGTNWADPYIYFWGHNGTAEPLTWPGVLMEPDTADGWFVYRIEGATKTNLIFSDNGKPQTGDLIREGDGWYKNGAWYSKNPDVQKPVTDTLLTVYYFNEFSWQTPTIYYWKHNGTAAEVTWPGVTMNELEDGWYSYQIEGATESNIIFSNNGQSQTKDLYRKYTGWYYQGAWTNTNPLVEEEVETSIMETQNEIPTDFGIEKVFPNPFNPTTTFTIKAAESTFVSLYIYNVMGQKVGELLNHSAMSSGYHQIKFDASGLSSGMYIWQVRFETNGITSSGKIMLVK